MELQEAIYQALSQEIREKVDQIQAETRKLREEQRKEQRKKQHEEKKKLGRELVYSSLIMGFLCLVFSLF